jgi:Spy/CpxP family protein refolding chaperone
MSCVNQKSLLLALAFSLAVGLTPALADPGMGAPGPGSGPEMGPNKMSCPCDQMGKPGKMEMFRPELLEKLADKIGADTQTVTKIKDLVYNANKQVIDLKAEMERNQLEMRRLMDQEAPDEKVIMQQIDKIGAVEIKLRKNRISLMLSVRKLLTPEQRTKLKELMPEKMGHERGMGPDNPPEPGQGHHQKNSPPEGE